MTTSNGDRALRNGRNILESYELVTRHQELDSNAHELDEDINPESDTSLLRRHYASSNESHDFLPQTGTPIELFQRFVSFMSRTPLLLRSSPAQGTGSYGALPVHDLSFSTDGSEIDEEDFNDIRRRDSRKGKGRKLRQAFSNDSSRSRLVKISGNGSTATRRTRRRQSELGVDATLSATPTVPAGVEGKLFENIIPDTNSVGSAPGEGEEDVGAHTDSDGDGWSVEHPADNSPLVKFLLVISSTLIGTTIRMVICCHPSSKWSIPAFVEITEAILID